jgi:hypothetical protein
VPAFREATGPPQAWYGSRPIAIPVALFRQASEHGRNKAA